MDRKILFPQKSSSLQDLIYELYILPLQQFFSSQQVTGHLFLGLPPVDGILIPNILALWKQKTCIEKNPEFETRKQEKLSSIFHWIYLHQKHMKLLV